MDPNPVKLAKSPFPEEPSNPPETERLDWKYLDPISIDVHKCKAKYMVTKNAVFGCIFLNRIAKLVKRASASNIIVPVATFIGILYCHYKTDVSHWWTLYCQATLILSISSLPSQT